MKIPRNKAARGQQTKSRKKATGKTRSVGQRDHPPPPPPVPKVWQPSDALEEDEELDFDVRAYDCLVRFTDTWPSLSLDVVADPAGPSTGDVHTVYFVSGTQASNPRDNYVSVTKVQNIQRLKSKEEGSEDASSEDSDDESSTTESSEESEKEVFFQQRLRHLSGINRLRCVPQDPRFLAVWSERGWVEIYDVTASLNRVQENQSTADSVAADPLFKHKHRSEGFALDWSRVKQGLLASGDCASDCKIWQPREGGQWNIHACTNGHAASVEDIQWSPTEETVFASASVDKTIKIWDSRDTNGARLTVEASKTDVNVLSWNKDVTYMLASGDDGGLLKVWDLRNFAQGESVAEFHFHKKSITSVEWCPHESSMLATSSDDNQIAIWDLALERDPEEEAQFAASENAQLPSDVPPQLLFLHAGQSCIKELHWHPQIKGMILSTAEDGINIFKCANI